MTQMKQLRKEKGYSQVKMQMLTGIDQSDYSKIETGKRNMTFEQCRRIADALETKHGLSGRANRRSPPLSPYQAETTQIKAVSVNLRSLCCCLLAENQVYCPQSIFKKAVRP